MTDQETKHILREILKWQKVQGLKTLQELLPSLLDDHKKRTVYEMTNGQNTQTDIAKKAGVAGGTVSNWWKLWYSYGILGKDKNRYTKITSLKELGIPVASSIQKRVEQHDKQTNNE